ncbi:HAD family phosphatase [Micromonospora musae]|uniref:HAD family phosphatase n=1 Tax=Micromonospora musae TaxID=1894970 RepID=A0ABX9RLV7_9ACTN|nr:HAD family phosphatase [Micromonospora musae]RKN24188.1 HAD family phosphatase [Micromonospora musae]
MSAALEQLGREVRALLLDFDGPVCSIFAGYPAPIVARELVQLLVARGAAFATDLADESDPLEVLRRTGVEADSGLTRAIEDALIAAEVRATATAEPTPCGREVIVAARQVGLSIAVVSNNSRQAVEAYLRTHRLNQHIRLVVGRMYAAPDRMKPNPEPILRAANALGVDPNLCLLLGDSLSDIEGAKASGTRVVGFANKSEKKPIFEQAGADAVVTSMKEVARALVRLDDAAGDSTSPSGS